MSFKSQLEDAFEDSLETFKTEEAGSCQIRFPVTKAGADLSGAANYDVIQAPTPDELTLMTGGFTSDYQFSLSARKADFPSTSLQTMEGMFLLKNGRVSRIKKVQDSVAGIDVSPILVLHCGDPTL